MNIAIIIHNHKGSTKYIADKLTKTFEKQNNSVDVLELEEVVLEENEVKTEIKLQDYPSIEDYDIIIFGAPLLKGELSPIMVHYLEKLPFSENKVCSGYITQFSFSLAKKGSVARDKMIDLCVKKNIKVKKVENIKWLNPFLGRDI